MKKAQMTQTMILIFSVVVIIAIAAVFTMIVNNKSKAVEQKLISVQKNIQGKELLLSLMVSKINVGNRVISVAEALNLALFDVVDDSELRNELDAILINFGYSNDAVLWKVSIIDPSDGMLYSVTQMENIGGFDLETLHGEVQFPHPFVDDVVVRLTSLED
jgi:hypothetical protein